MDETILFPSPNWYQVSGLAVTEDGWVAYGGPSKSLCVLEPLPADYSGVIQENIRYKAHVLNRAHPDKIVSIDISPEWPEKRLLLTGSANGSVKQWNLEYANKLVKIKSSLSHDVHTQEKEETVGVAYSNETYALTVGSFGNIVKWDLNSNVVKAYSNILKSFKPVSMACSRHMPLHVAVGTKQGVLFVIDLTGSGKILCKVRGQDDEIMNVSWCPQFEVNVQKSLDESRVNETESLPSKLHKQKKFSANDRMEKIRQEKEPEEDRNTSGVIKNLPDDSFDDFEIVQQNEIVEDDMFDIYKDHEADEFGHKKYQPEDIIVKIKKPEKEVDYLAECLKLKETILKKKHEPEPSIESLVESLDKTKIDNLGNAEDSIAAGSSEDTIQFDSVSSVHTQKCLLATIGRQGSVRIWSKTGKLIGSCAVPSSGKFQQGRHKISSWATLLWCTPDILLIADAKGQLMECNPLKMDCKNKLEVKVLHSVHKRNLFCIASSAPRVQTGPTEKPYHVWTMSQDRIIVCYSVKEREIVAVHNTCGGFLYNIQSCPYDATKVAVSVGDGAVRVWSAEESETDENKLLRGNVTSYWQHVQGKVLTVAWHPTTENLLAFGTAESRVGLIEASGKVEKAAKVLRVAPGAVYSLGWGSNALYCSGGGALLEYSLKGDSAPKPISVELEGAKWSISAVRVREPLLAVGSDAGAVAVVTQEHGTMAAVFPFSKMIHTIDWHPLQTSGGSEESVYKNFLAVCSLDKANTIAILEYGDKEDDAKKLQVWKTLAGHTGTVLQVSWSPHEEARLLSTSQDGTVRIWNVLEGTCTSIFGGHCATALTAAWSALPQFKNKVLSGGVDCCLRLWDTEDHPADSYCETKEEPAKREKKKKQHKEKNAEKADSVDTSPDTDDGLVAVVLEHKKRPPKKFLLPTISKQITHSKLKGAKKMLDRYLDKQNGTHMGVIDEVDLDYIKIFSNTNEVNEVFDMEMESHLQYGNFESWIMLSIFRGHIDAMMQFANEKNLICPYLLSIAPSVSSKYWKDASRMYLAQIDRLVANGEEDKLCVNSYYGGPVYRKAATLLSLQDVKGAVATLTEARLYKEAYMLCRIRYIDTIAEEVLQDWAKTCVHSGLTNMAVVCYIALGKLHEAATLLGKSNDEDSLSLAAELAKVAGQTTFADHIEDKKAQVKEKQVENTEEILEQLPSRIELLMKDDKGKDETCNGE